MFKYGVFSGPYLPIFCPSTRKYGPEKLGIWTLFKPVIVTFDSKDFENFYLHVITNIFVNSVPFKLKNRFVALSFVIL